MSKIKKSLILIFVSLFLFPVFVFAANYPNGTLLREENGIKVYVVHNQKKRWIRNIDIFNSYNFRWGNIKVISKKDLSVIKENELIRLKGDDKVYLIDGNEAKEHIKSAKEFESRDFNWLDVAGVNKKELDFYEEVAEVTSVTSASPSPSPSPKATEGAATPTPASSAGPTSTPTPPIPAKINKDLPVPDYIRADWLISHITSNYGRVGQRIVFKYSSKEKDKIENFNLYEKKPGSKYFYKIAGFEEILSTGCEDIDIDGEWMLIEAGECGYWSIQRVMPPGGRNTIAYLPAPDYLIGEYAYYVAGADKDGSETKPSSETKLVFLDAVDILNPVHNKQIDRTHPTFKWTITDKWPADSVADYFVMISDSVNALNPVWTRQFKIPVGETGKQFDYDGVGLDSNSKYRVNIYGHYRKSEQEPDYISISQSIPEFWIRKLGWTSLFKNIFASILGLFF